jgi:hypothetical protein
MIIDCHNHPDWHGHNLDKVLANMDQYAIDVTWLLAWECPGDEYDPATLACFPDPGPDGPIPFRRCLSYVERAPGRFILGVAPDPRKPYALERLKSAVAIYGVRIYGELKLRMMYDNPDALAIYRYCGASNIPVLVHIDYDIDAGAGYPRRNWWYGGGIEAFERVISLCPETNFIGHAPGFWAHISGDDQYRSVCYPQGKIAPGGKLVKLLRTYPNVSCDLSAGSGSNALQRDPEFARDFLIEFQDRILYGRDCFDNSHQTVLKSLGLPEAVLTKIFSGNALRLVSI